MKAYNLQTALQHREQVTELYLHGLGMAGWPGIVFELPQLQALSLSGNRLESVPEEIGRLNGLHTLDLSHNSLSRFPAVLARLPALRRLDLSGNGIARLPGRFHHGEQLRVLKLGNNRIKVLPDRWDNLDNLEELDLERNRLTTLPGWLGELCHLRTLNLGQNLLREFPLSAGQYQALEALNLEQNKLQSLSPHIGGCASLAELNLRSNELERLPGSLGELRKLRRLWLDHNRLGELPSSLGHAESLRLFSCQDNEIGQWPGFLASLPRLQTLELGHNRIGAIPPSPGRWPALEFLGLQQNGLSSIPPGLAALPVLKEIHLGRNLFSRFPEELVACPQIGKATGLPGAAQAIRFIQACRDSGLQPPFCIELFRLWQGEDRPEKISDEALRLGLRLPLPSLRKVLLPKLTGSYGPAPEPGRSVVALAGRILAGRQHWKETLEKAGLAMWEGGDGMPTHVVAGAGALDLPLAWIRGGVVFAEEGEMLRQVQVAGASFLRDGGDQVQLRFLLRSRQEATLRLALELMKSGGVPAELMTELYIAWKSATSGGLKRDLRNLLLLQATASGRRFLEIKNPFRSAAVLEQACRDTEFDAVRLWQWWQARTGV